VTIRVIFRARLYTPSLAETSAKLAYFNKGTMLEVLGDEGDFLHVRMHDSTVGYVRRSYAVAV
jgi:hypothetical protein